MARTNRNSSRDAGVALLAVMCTVTVLILMAVAFSNSVQIETRTAIYGKEAAVAHALAEGGVQAAILEIAYPLPADQTDQPRLWREGQRLMEVPYDNGRAVVEIVNESGKIDLNAAGAEQLARLFEARGLASGGAVQLAEAIVAWRNPPPASEDQDKQSAALDAYYQAAGYRAAHAPFKSVEEVLRVRGMTRDIFYGTAELNQERVERKYGLSQDLTIYSRSPQVNVNYASEAVLRSVPGVNEDLAKRIIKERSSQPFQSLDDLTQRLAVSLPEETLPFLGTASSSFYSIAAVGEPNGSHVRREVRAVIQRAGERQARHRVIGWYDDEVSE